MNLDTPIFQLCGQPAPKTGDIGLEIEVEGKFNYSPEDSVKVSKYWAMHNDPSLRHGMELSLNKPLEMKDVPLALAAFKEFSKTCKFSDSIRTSIHIHINVSAKTQAQVLRTIAVWWLFEDLLIRTQPSSRYGNLHCLPLSLAEGTFFLLKKGMTRGSPFEAFRNGVYRYAALNLDAITKFGSLEFRFLAFTPDIDVIQMWCKNLLSFVSITSGMPPDSMVNLMKMTVTEALANFFDAEFCRFVKRNSDLGCYDHAVSTSAYFIDSLMNMMNSHSGEVIDFGDEDLTRDPFGFDPVPEPDWDPDEPDEPELDDF